MIEEEATEGNTTLDRDLKAVESFFKDVPSSSSTNPPALAPLPANATTGVAAVSQSFTADPSGLPNVPTAPIQSKTAMKPNVKLDSKPENKPDPESYTDTISKIPRTTARESEGEQESGTPVKTRNGLANRLSDLKTDRKSSRQAEKKVPTLSKIALKFPTQTRAQQEATKRFQETVQALTDAEKQLKLQSARDLALAEAKALEERLKRLKLHKEHALTWRQQAEAAYGISRDIAV